MPSVELSKLQGITAARALSESDRAQLSARSDSAAKAGTVVAGKPGVAIEVSSAIDTATPPVETERVEQIRKALQDGTYPLVPAKVADAIIAARVGFGMDTK